METLTETCRRALTFARRDRATWEGILRGAQIDMGRAWVAETVRGAEIYEALRASGYVEAWWDEPHATETHSAARDLAAARAEHAYAEGYAECVLRSAQWVLENIRVEYHAALAREAAYETFLGTLEMVRR